MPVWIGADRRVNAADEPAPEQAKENAVEQLVKRARASVVVISFRGRDGQPVGVGTGFVVKSDGLIATNLHVIGEARHISVRTADGREHEATSVHASDRHLDLALVKIDARDLPTLELGDSDGLKSGQPIVALGNPHGLERSVVTGVVSGTRRINGRSMIQIAMPVEPGNSGGPVLDMSGKVHGVVTIKSAVTQNLGFAMPVNALKPMLAKPNPVPMDRWVTIGALDADHWEAKMGGQWRQRAGRIVATSQGRGFGGRTLCLSTRPEPKRPYEIAVSVRMSDESGAAGLAFCSDGGDRHYGFYPSNGNIRLTRFDGANVFTWRVLHDKPSVHYRPGDWNTLKVRLEPKRILCYVNDELVVESDDTGLKSGRVGLAKFRTTDAEFRRFQLGDKLPAARPTAAQVGAITDKVADVTGSGELNEDVVASLVDAGPTTAVLSERAKRLEAEAEQLRRLAGEVHRKRVRDELVTLLKGKPEKVDLFHAALLVAYMDNEEIEVQGYRDELDRMAAAIRERLPKDAPPVTKRAMLNRYLFEENAYHGSRTNYYNRSNSYINEVMDDREGLPITLSILYIELGKRIGLKLVGASLPGHFMVRDVTDKDEPQLIDVYERGKVVSRDEAALRVVEITGVRLEKEHLEPAAPRDVILRMLYNLMGVARQEDPTAGPLPYLDAILAIDPKRSQERWVRAVLRYQAKRYRAALADAGWLLENEPDGVDLQRVRRLYNAIEQARPKP